MCPDNTMSRNLLLILAETTEGSAVQRTLINSRDAPFHVEWVSRCGDALERLGRQGGKDFAAIVSYRRRHCEWPPDNGQRIQIIIRVQTRYRRWRIRGAALRFLGRTVQTALRIRSERYSLKGDQGCSTRS
jgi:hypothetical protein